MPAFVHPAIPRPGARPIGTPLLWSVLALVGLAATVVLWLQPSTTTSEITRPLRATYVFDHDVELPDNPVYEGRTLRLGDPVFLAVVDSLEVTVDYLLGSPSEVIEVQEGSAAAIVEVVSSAGWQRTLARSGPVDLVDRRASLSVPVDLAAAQVLADEIDAATGVSGSLTVRVRAEASADGRLTRPDLGQVPVQERSSAEVAFALGRGTAELLTPPRSEADPVVGAIPGIVPGTAAALGGDAAPGSDAAPAVSDPTHPGRREVVSMVSAETSAPASLTLLGRDVELTWLRSAASVLTLLAAALAVYGVWSHRRGGGGAVEAIAAAHHADLVPAARLPAVPADRVIDLARFDDLLRIGRELQLPVVVRPQGDIVTYAVTDGLTRYRFETLVDAPRHATVTTRSVTTRPGRRADDPPGSLVVVDRPVPAAQMPRSADHGRRAGDLDPGPHQGSLHGGPTPRLPDEPA